MISNNEVFTLKLHRDNMSTDKHENVLIAKEFGYKELLRIVTILAHREHHTLAERSLLRCIRYIFSKLSEIEESCNLKNRTFIPEIKTKRAKKEEEVASEPVLPSVNVD